MRVRRTRVILIGMPDSVAMALEPYRRELTGHCRQVLGSTFEAEDAAQETIVRAWRCMDGFEGRSALRSWLRRIATNVCHDMLRRPQRRALPVADIELAPAGADPAEVAESQEAIRVAFATALVHLPARQRAVLILRDVLRWRASEVAELLGASVASVNSALQRARATLGARDLDARHVRLEGQQRELLSRYTQSFERHDIGTLVSLLRDELARSGTSNRQPAGPCPSTADLRHQPGEGIDPGVGEDGAGRRAVMAVAHGGDRLERCAEAGAIRERASADPADTEVAEAGDVAPREDVQGRVDG
jgi:RNA polymerase sigma factor (sigma-70 family)